MRSWQGVGIHPTAQVASNAHIGEGTRIWHQAQVRDGAVIGRNCILGKGVFVDLNVHIGNHCKLQNGVFVYHGFDVEDGVFLGPGALLLNDKHPRAINPDGSLKTNGDWIVSTGRVAYGASVGGGAIILPGVSIGRFALVGAGAVVTKDVPDHGIVYGNPAKLHSFACACAHWLQAVDEGPNTVRMRCSVCNREYDILRAAHKLQSPVGV